MSGGDPDLHDFENPRRTPRTSTGTGAYKQRSGALLAHRRHHLPRRLRLLGAPDGLLPLAHRSGGLGPDVAQPPRRGQSVTPAPVALTRRPIIRPPGRGDPRLSAFTESPLSPASAPCFVGRRVRPSEHEEESEEYLRKKGRTTEKDAITARRTRDHDRSHALLEAGRDDREERATSAENFLATISRRTHHPHASRKRSSIPAFQGCERGRRTTGSSTSRR